MARVNLRCGCGFFFAVPDTQLAAGVKCPSCLRPVSLEGPPDGSVPPPPRADDVKVAAPSKITFSRGTMALAGGGFAVLVLGTLWFLMSGEDGRKDEPSRSTPRRPVIGEGDRGSRATPALPGGS
ncbi:MAG TPA: hypothetical protein VEN81_13745, partial [Planctomycetota bacterium]|nr:hypothetical protein [Planctomycetota bacterium]